MGDDEGPMAGDVAAGVGVAAAGCCEEVQRREGGGITLVATPAVSAAVRGGWGDS